MTQSIIAHPNFQTSASWSLDVLSFGTDDIIVDTSQSIGAIVSKAVSPQVYSNLTVTYTLVGSYTSDVNFQTNSQSISVIENTIAKTTPDVSWSVSGTTSMTYSVANYLTAAPSWVAINSVTSELTITAPDVDKDTEYYFYINSMITGITNPIQKLIKLSILNWIASNWQKCTTTNNSIWTAWTSGYNLSSGLWSIQNSSQPQNSTSASEPAKALSTTTISVEAAVLGCVVFTSILNASSISSFWMTINQLQIFFFKYY